MQLRRNLRPKTVMDVGAVTFLLVMIQIIYWFELFLVIPEYYEDGHCFVLSMTFLHYWFELFVVLPDLYLFGERLYYVHFCIGTWLLFNIVGNFVIAFLLDTSIRSQFLSSEMRPNWRFCDVCEAITPPRSWHCSVCDVCILKRDHHCNFTACCVGHNNHRYFMMFLLHLGVATVYASYFNAIFLWKNTLFTLAGFLKLMFPVAIFMFGGDMSATQLYRLFCVITIIGMVAAVTLGGYHFQNVLNGQVMHERVKNITDYDLGRMENVKQVFGNRWYLTWISPFVTSELPCDGIEWERVKKSSTKSK